MNGKGDKRRQPQISRELADLKYDLAFCKDAVKREELKKKIADLEKS